MKYFLLASKFSVITHCNTRTISYKVRKSLLYMLTKMEQNNTADTGAKVNLNERGQQSLCPRFTIQVVTNGACESGGLIVQTGTDNYLFNCGEGVQRCATSYGIKLLKTCALFVTSHTWANIGGIMGVALTLQGLGVRKFFIYGPPALKKVIAGWESFVQLKSLTVKVITDNPKLVFYDGCLKVEFVPLYGNSTASTHKSHSQTTLNYDIEQNVKSTDSDKIKIQINQSELRTDEESDVYVQCYICKTPNFGQHIDVDACIQKGLEIGPVLKMLQDNKSVTLNDGKVVHLEEVCTSTGESKIFIVVECPSKKFLDSLVNEEAFTPYQEFSSKPADMIIHFSPPEVMNEPLYQEWMLKFPKSTKHLVINSDNVFADLIPVYHVQTKLNYLSQEIFPLLNANHLPIVKEELCGKMGKATIFNILGFEHEEKERKFIESKKKKNDLDFVASSLFQYCPRIFEYINGMRVIRPLSTLFLSYHPKSRFDYKHNIAYDPFNCLNEMKSLGGMTKDLNELADFIRKWQQTDTYKKLSDYPKVLFLGTGSSTPSRYRSTSAILVYINEDNLALLDCGEGTYQQLVRVFGKEKMPEFMKKLKMIYVSHHHADHHMGMINILIMRQKLLAGCENPESILILVPAFIAEFLYGNEKLFESFLNNTKIVRNSIVIKENWGMAEELNRIGVSDLRLCHVDHCRNSSGISIVINNNFKITYSGDCRPSQSLVEIGRGSDLLIHEATFEDDLMQMAKQKYHSTTSQAIAIGKRMEAKFTILTHFSQRYASMPPVPDNIPGNVAIAFDNMMVNAKTFPILPKMFGLYKMVFADKLEKLNHKLFKRSVKRENESQDSAKIRITS